MEYKKQSHCLYYCDYHIVLATKYRRKVFNPWVLEYFKIKLQEVSKYYPAVELKEYNGEEDHIHILVSIPPKMNVSDVVRVIKVNTSKWLKKKFTFFKSVYRGTDWIWSDGYFVSTEWLNEKTIREYIRRQWEEDSGQAKLVLG